MTLDEIIAKWGHRLRYFEILSKAKTNITEPFLYLTETLLKKGNIKKFATIGSEVKFGLTSLHKLLEAAKLKNDLIEGFEA